MTRIVTTRIFSALWTLFCSRIIRNGRTNVIRQLLSYEKSSVYINESDENGMTPLHAASTEGTVPS